MMNGHIPSRPGPWSHPHHVFLQEDDNISNNMFQLLSRFTRDGNFILNGEIPFHGCNMANMQPNPVNQGYRQDMPNIGNTNNGPNLVNQQPHIAGQDSQHMYNNGNTKNARHVHNKANVPNMRQHVMGQGSKQNKVKVKNTINERRRRKNKRRAWITLGDLEDLDKLDGAEGVDNHSVHEAVPALVPRPLTFFHPQGSSSSGRMSAPRIRQTPPKFTSPAGVEDSREANAMARVRMAQGHVGRLGIYPHGPMFFQPDAELYLINGGFVGQERTLPTGHKIWVDPGTDTAVFPPDNTMTGCPVGHASGGFMGFGPA